MIATENSSIGMGGPAMIEGGGLGVFHPAEVGPIDVQDAAGVVDLRVADEAAAIAAAKRYLGYFRGDAEPVAPPDPDALRTPDPGQPQARLRRPGGDRRAVRRRQRARAPPRLRRRHRHRARPPRRPGARRRSPTTRTTSAARSTPRPPTRRRGS